MRKYRLVGTYYAEIEIETDLTGDELFNHYSAILNSAETKQRASLVNGDRLFICECDSGYKRSAAKFCSQCGRLHVFDTMPKASESTESA